MIVEGYTDVIALHQAGVPETVAQMGTALTEQQVDAIARLAPKALLCQDPDSAGQASAQRGLEALIALMKSDKWRTRSVEFKIVRLPVQAGPGGRRPGRRGGRDAARCCRPRCRSSASRSSARSRVEGPSTDELLAEAIRIIAPMPVSVLRDELVKFTADRLGINVQIVHEVLRGTTPAPSMPQPPWDGRQGGWQDRDGRQWNGRSAANGPLQAAVAAARADRPARRLQPPRPRAKRPTSPTASRCPRRASSAWRRSRSRTTSPRPRAARPPPTCAGTCATRARTSRAATRTSPASWPSSRSTRTALEATPAKLELEALQLDLHRLERHISSARLSGTTRRQRPRRRAPEGPRRDPPSPDLSRPFPSATRTSVRVRHGPRNARRAARRRPLDRVDRARDRPRGVDRRLLGQQARPELAHAAAARAARRDRTRGA